MNSNLNRALAVALAAFAGAVPALAQFDGDRYCIDPNNTKPYSDVFIYQEQETPLFRAAMGAVGTTAYGGDKGALGAVTCGSSGPIAGRIGFSIGAQGSIQDNLLPNGINGLHDDYLKLTFGASFGDEDPTRDPIFPAGFLYSGPFITPASGGNSFARIYLVRTPAGGTPTRTDYLYGGTGIGLFFAGANGRYIYSNAQVTTDIAVRCVVEVLADTARLNWRLTNNIQTTDTVQLGLDFSQVVDLLGENGSNFTNFENGPLVYTTIPGRRPLTVGEQFPGTVQSTVPPYVNFSMSQAAGYGLQIVNNSSALTTFDASSGVDQTPVDALSIGEAPFLISGGFSTTNPTQDPTGILRDGNFEAPLNGDPAYIQIWNPVTVPTGQSRNIVSYYRATNGDSSYSPQTAGYSVVVDTPKAITTSAAAIANGDANPFSSSRYTIRVNVDNTGGFSEVDREVAINSVSVTLALPAGLTNPDTGQRTTTRTISGSIAARSIGFVDFPVTVDPTVFGPQTYTVTVTPTPGEVKSVTGTINVAAAPRLLIRPLANLVSPPFQFADSTWESILGLTLNDQFQAYSWDAQRQQYVTQTSAVRAQGTWIISDSNQNFVTLGGAPSQPNDEFPDANNSSVGQNGGTASIRLQPGWNLVGNPYNYAFPLGQLVGVPVGTTTAYDFNGLVTQGITDGAFQFYDQDDKEYVAISGAGNPDARLLPNYGYWIYANFAVDLQFPPLFELFIRSGAHKEPTQKLTDWKLQLSAQSSGARDTQEFVGVDTDANLAQGRSVRKSPMPPASAADLIYGYITGDRGAMAQTYRSSTGKQSFTYNVYSKKGGAVTVSWPNLKKLPTSLQVTVTDPSTKKTVNARTTSGYTFSAKAASVKQLTVTVAPTPPAPERITSATYALVRVGNARMAKLSYTVSGPGTATIGIFQGSRSLGNVVSGVDAAAGVNTVTWPLTDGNGQALPNGNYTLVFSVKGEGGDVATRALQVAVRR